MSSPVRLMALGMLILQLTWVVAVPPFRGSDEFDHVYKAAAVARGDWIPSPASATRGTGAWLLVPADIVDAAHAQCAALPYTDDDDCVGTRDGDVVRIASGAGRYHPLFYAIVGTPAIPFSGYTALYVMRIATVLLSWLLFCAALLATRNWARGRWPAAAIAIASTPVLIYSSAVVAPNGVELMAGLAFWCACIALARGDRTQDLPRILSIVGASGALLLATRSLGPLWCALIVATVLAATPPRVDRIRTLVRDWRFVLTGAALLLVGIQSVWFIAKMGSLEVGTPNPDPISLGGRAELVSKDLLLWLFQSIAAFPLRNQSTHHVVYVCFLLLFLSLFVLAFRAGRGQDRIALVGCALIAYLVPFVIAVATYNDYPAAWQGRYGMPYAVGIAVLAGLVLDRRSDPRVGMPLRVAGLLVFVPAQATGPVDVMLKSLRRPLADASHWLHPGEVTVAAMGALGAALLWLAATRPSPPGERAEHMQASFPPGEPSLPGNPGK